MYQNPIYIYISSYKKICWFSAKKCWCQQNSMGVLFAPFHHAALKRSILNRVNSFVILLYLLYTVNTTTVCTSNLKTIFGINPKLLNFSHDYPSKKIVKICMLEMLRLSDFDIMTTFTMWLLEKMSCKALFICISQYSKLY